MRTFATEKCFYLLKSADLGSHFWFVRINYVTFAAQSCPERKNMARKKEIPIIAALVALMALLLTFTACSKDNEDEMAGDNAPGVEVCIVFAPGELGDQGLC